MSGQFKHLPRMPQKNYLSFNAGLMNLFYSQ